MNAYDKNEIFRLISSFVTIGTITEVDFASSKARVSIGENVTDWIYWGCSRAGALRQWAPPSVGEQVVIVAPYGDLGQGVIIASLYQEAMPAPSSSETAYVTRYPDGSLITYESDQHTLTVKLAQGGRVEIVGDVVISGSLNVQGEITGHSGGVFTGGDVTVDGIGVKGHHHTAQGQNAATTPAQA